MKNLLGILEKITPVSWWIDPSQYMEWPAKKFVIFYSAGLLSAPDYDTLI